MATKKDVPLLACGRPTVNGRIYDKEDVQKAIDKIQPPLFGLLGPADSLNIPLNEIAFVAENLKFNDYHILVADIRTLDTPKGFAIAPILDLCDFTTVGTGIYGLDGVIKDFNLSYISAIPKQAHAKL